MRSSVRRAGVALFAVAGAILISTVPVVPQVPAPAPGPQGAAQGPQGPAQPGQPAGRGGRGGLGGPQENDPANATADYGPKPPTAVLPPEEEARKIWLPPGFKLEPVLTDPHIEDGRHELGNPGCAR